MLDKKDFEDMRREYHLNDSLREELIKKSRDLLKISKQLIYAVHKNDMKNCAEYSKKAKKILNELRAIIKKSPALEFSGAFRSAVEEFAEAQLYYNFIKTGKIPSHKAIGVDSELYLLGLSDLTGELIRKAVFLAGKGNIEDVLKIRDLIDGIYGEMIGFDLRSSELRKKFDSIKYNLKKIESIVLDLQIKKR